MNRKEIQDFNDLAQLEFDVKYSDQLKKALNDFSINQTKIIIQEYLPSLIGEYQSNEVMVSVLRLKLNSLNSGLNSLKIQIQEETDKAQINILLDRYKYLSEEKRSAAIELGKNIDR